MARDASLQAALDAWKVIKDKANDELQALLNQYKGQLDLLQEFFGKGEEAGQKLEEIASKGAEAIPDGLRQDVLEAYNRLAQIIADAPDELKPLVDPEGVQAARVLLTAQAIQLLQSSSGTTTGIAALVAWWVALSTAAKLGLTAAGLALLLAGLYFATKATSGVDLSGTWIEKMVRTDGAWNLERMSIRSSGVNRYVVTDLGCAGGPNDGLECGSVIHEEPTEITVKGRVVEGTTLTIDDANHMHDALGDTWTRESH